MSWSHLAFWRRPPVADLDALAAFVDERSAFLVQKGIYEYSRARAGHYSKVLFGEQEFLDALEQSRWRAFPLGLAMVGELVEGILRPHAGAEAARHLHCWRGFVLSVFDRYPAPASLGEPVWRDARTELGHRLQLLGLHPPKRAIDIPAPYARAYWNLMPIHKEARSSDFPTTHSYLQVVLCNIHDELTRRADVPTLARQLREAAAGSPVPLAEGEESPAAPAMGSS